jgi:hypothetical protein
MRGLFVFLTIVLTITANNQTIQILFLTETTNELSDFNYQNYRHRERIEASPSS